jgi:DNA replication protein DnaC
MGRTKRIASKSKFTLCPNEASEWWGIAHDNELADVADTNVFINNHQLDNGEILYEGIESQNIISETTNYPIYAMILQMEAMELHKLECLIEKNGGTILDRNTDAIRYTAKKEMNITDYYWDDKKEVQKYQKEEAKPLQVERLSSFCRADNLDKAKFNLGWNITYDYDVTADEKAKEIIDSNKSFHIDGRAGTGKSYLTNKVIDQLKQNDIKYLAFSPTNKGARIIGGRTIHSVYYKFKHNKYKLMDMLKKVKYIIIDEISMMVEMFYQLFIMIKKIY